CKEICCQMSFEFVNTGQMWERACSRRGQPIQHYRCLTHRFREQARSHIGITAPTFAMHHFNASANGNRAMCVAFSDPRYNQSPYSRAVVIGE
ncbi:hypothetical protein C1895_00005, partial [Pseudomonas sp. FW305-3-2-15-E-TSA4]